MEIKNLHKEDIASLYNFNRRMYPERKLYRKILDFWLNKEPDAYKLFNIVCDNKIIYGQSLFSPMNYFYNNEKKASVWGFDLIVDESERKNIYGIDLLLYGKERFKESFATGSGPDALKINLKLGNKLIGEIKKYVGILNPIYFVSPFRGVIPIKKFHILSNNYEKIDANSLPDRFDPYNNDLLEISREKDFLKWRFFNELQEYAVYKMTDSDNYFVLRTIVKKHITCMVLVDFRCNMSNANEFEAILKSVKRIMNKLRLSILITGSSLSVSDIVLEKYHFKALGRNRPIISTVSFKNRQEDMNDRKFVFVTLADSDGEILW